MRMEGNVRKVNKLGGVVLPKKIRDTMELSGDTPMEIFTDANTIILRKYQPGCTFCGSMDKLTEFSGKRICGCCMDYLRKGAEVNAEHKVWMGFLQTQQR